uniref:Uncharacterized protein n=1 Tax=Arundo donax TaxID=35708 RepID=A0A0A8ZBS8_ARUDO
MAGKASRWEPMGAKWREER